MTLKAETRLAPCLNVKLSEIIMEYLQRALSKDPSRYNMHYILRREIDAVATDGYRMHRQLDLPTATPQLIGCIDGSFTADDYPNVDLVLKDTVNCREVFSLRLDKPTLRQLTTYAKVSKELLRATFKKIGPDLLEVTCKRKGFSISFELKAHTIESPSPGYIGDQVLGGYNFQHFVDALVPDCTVEVAVNGDHMMTLKHHGLNGKFEAVIMGMRG